MAEELNGERKLHRDVGELGSEVGALAERTIGALESVSVMLEHIGSITKPSASASGLTPLMSP